MLHSHSIGLQRVLKKFSKLPLNCTVSVFKPRWSSHRSFAAESDGSMPASSREHCPSAVIVVDGVLTFGKPAVSFLCTQKK